MIAQPHVAFAVRPNHKPALYGLLLTLEEWAEPAAAAPRLVGPERSCAQGHRP